MRKISKIVFKRLLYWISYPQRWIRRKGFGIHSPWAFEFVTEVLFSKHRFYAFDVLGGTIQHEQLFKIVNWLKPAEVVLNTDEKTETDYLTYPLKSNKPESNGRVFYYDRFYHTILDIDTDCHEFQNGDCVIVDGITTSSDEAWVRLTNSGLTTSTFELYDRGIAFFDKGRQRQKYKL